MRKPLLTLAVLGSALVAMAANEPTVVGWRMDTSGRYPDATPPLHWATDKNVAWTTAMPGWSSSSPVLIGDRLVVTADPAWLMCVSAADGKVIWQTENTVAALASKEDQDDYAARVAKRAPLTAQVAEAETLYADAAAKAKAAPADAALKGAAQEAAVTASALKRELDALPNGKAIKPDGTVSQSCCTPVSDGKSVVALYNSGMLVCYDLDGKLRWARFLQKVGIPYGQSMSPALVGGVLGVCIDTCMYGIDLATGKTLWTDYEMIHQASPIGLTVGETPIFFTSEGNVRNAKDGKILVAKAAGVMTLFDTPALVGDTAFVVCENRRLTSVQFRPKADGGIEVRGGGFGVEKGIYYASPLVTDDTVYVWNTANYNPKVAPRALIAYDRKTGKPVTIVKTDLTGWGYPSPCLAGPFIFIATDKGTTIVLLPQKDRSMKEVARNTIEGFAGTPIFAGDRMYVRTKAKLYCIAASDDDKAEAKRLIAERDQPAIGPPE
jgi:outer membrane protein assembly factor BamB